jgi:hypothetical protein
VARSRAWPNARSSVRQDSYSAIPSSRDPRATASAPRVRRHCAASRFSPARRAQSRARVASPSAPPISPFAHRTRDRSADALAQSASAPRAVADAKAASRMSRAVVVSPAAVARRADASSAACAIGASSAVRTRCNARSYRSRARSLRPRSSAARACSRSSNAAASAAPTRRSAGASARPAPRGRAGLTEAHRRDAAAAQGVRGAPSGDRNTRWASGRAIVRLGSADWESRGERRM